MRGKYKIGLFRLALLAGAVLLGWLAMRAETAGSMALLWLASLWLIATALLMDLSHRWPARTPWQLVPGLLLAGLLWLAPQQYAAWLWGWAILLMLPQPWWTVVLNALLAIHGWWQVQAQLDAGQATLVGLLLAALMLLGLARARALMPLWQRVRRRQRLLPGERLWSLRQLGEDLAREAARCDREGSHAELVLVSTRGRHCWPMARRLCRLIRDYEHCYRLDRRTLAVVLISRDLDQARERRRALLDGLALPLRARVIALNHALVLAEEHRALKEQQPDLIILEEGPAHA